MHHDTRVSRLKSSSAIFVGFGLLLFLGLVTPLAGLMNLFIDLAFMPYDGAQITSSDPTQLMTAITGGMLAGWGLMFWLVTTRIYANDPTLGKTIMLPSILIWFLLDSLVSVIVGAWFNVVMNADFLILIAGPILWPNPKSRTA
ncbi:MAG: hypothetical protein ACI92Z_002542 [Paracoccaceae bacterium]|jgi:hypothetical protein